MGLRSRLAGWLQPRATAATPAAPAAATLLEQPHWSCPACRDLEARVAKLELERPAFVLELESLLETAQDILARSESKRALAAAKESKLKKREGGAVENGVELPLDRAAMLANVRANLRAQGKLP